VSHVRQPPTPADSPSPAQIASHHLTALSAAVVGIVGDHCGRAPTEVRTVHFEEHVITILQDGPTPADQEAMNAEFVRAAERALGRRVLSHRRSLHLDSHISFEIFLLANEGTGSTRRGGLHLVGGTESR
jgi:hypothetical protein